MDEKRSLLSYLPKPLLEDILRGRVIPFVGSGFSKNADMPDTVTMPDWKEMGELIAQEISGYSGDDNVLDILSYYEHSYGRSKLIEKLMVVLNVGKVQPGDIHQLFCDIFTGTICTTNYDSLLEDTIKMQHRPASTIVSEDRLSIMMEGEGRVLKLHGDFDHPDRMVVTEYDYDTYIINNPIFATFVANLFISNTMLLIGYSLDDDDFRSVWQIINNRLGRMTRSAYAIEVEATPEKVARFNRRNINVINLPKSTEGYSATIRVLLEELRGYISKRADQTASSTDEAINEQFIIPAEDNRLCYISCPMTRIARLSYMLYPMLERERITPVRLDEIVLPEDNWTEKAKTAIRKSRLVIVDISEMNQNVSFEFGLAQAYKKNTLLIRERQPHTPPASYTFGSVVIEYSFDNKDITSDFSRHLAEWIQDNTARQDEERASNGPTLIDNAYNLYEKSEYSAAILEAYSVLEYIISLLPGYSSYEKYNWSAAGELLKNFIQSSTDNDNILDEVRTMRDKIVHTGYVASQQEAKSVLEYVSLVSKQALEHKEK